MHTAGYTVLLLITILCNDGAANPFSFWDNLDKKEPQKVTFSIDSAFTRSDMHQYGAENHEYKDYTSVYSNYNSDFPHPASHSDTFYTNLYAPSSPELSTYAQFSAGSARGLYPYYSALAANTASLDGSSCKS